MTTRTGATAPSRRSRPRCGRAGRVARPRRDDEAPPRRVEADAPRRHARDPVREAIDAPACRSPRPRTAWGCCRSCCATTSCNSGAARRSPTPLSRLSGYAAAIAVRTFAPGAPRGGPIGERAGHQRAVRRAPPMPGAGRPCSPARAFPHAARQEGRLRRRRQQRRTRCCGAGALTGMRRDRLALAGPDPDVDERSHSPPTPYGGTRDRHGPDPATAVADAHAVYTADVWASMATSHSSATPRRPGRSRGRRAPDGQGCHPRRVPALPTRAPRRGDRSRRDRWPAIRGLHARAANRLPTERALIHWTIEGGRC